MTTTNTPTTATPTMSYETWKEAMKADPLNATLRRITLNHWVKLGWTSQQHSEGTRLCLQAAKVMLRRVRDEEEHRAARASLSHLYRARSGI